MTGFGKAEVIVDNKKFTAEIRSLNSKQLDLSIKIPTAYRAVEVELRNTVAQRLVRGKIDVMVTVESTEAETAAQINRELFRNYLHQITDALAFSAIDADYDSIVPSVLRMPGVVATETAEVSEAELQAIKEAVATAAERFDEFRVQEGRTLIGDLLRRVDKIEAFRNEITPFEQARADAIRTKSRENIAKLGIEVDNNRLEQEMIFYIEKLDITEEKVRLQNHCKYFREVAENEPQAGRKLGFIAQEMGREINTTGSKANQHDIQILVVKMKDELEKIKEQVLNLL